MLYDMHVRHALVRLGGVSGVRRSLCLALRGGLLLSVVCHVLSHKPPQWLRDTPAPSELVDELDVKPHLVLMHGMNLLDA